MDIDKNTTALLSLDFQHDIVSVDGKFGAHGLGAEVEAAGAIPNAARPGAASGWAARGASGLRWHRGRR